MKARVDAIQQRSHDLLQRGGAAIVDLLDSIVAAKQNGTAPERIERALKLQRRAQWRLDFIAAENSMGFHAPQEAARVLGEAIDYARQGQVVLLGGTASVTTTQVSDAKPASSAAASATPSAAPNLAPRPAPSGAASAAPAQK